jgi:hypothetical protein
MMSDLYREVFAEPCPDLTGIELAARYHLTDRRIAEALLEARGQVAADRVVGGDTYRTSRALPFVFADRS